ncbi:MAG: polyphosphate polymerase domain-containing protein [candidate division KSB1 bacterium]|nr:polyphosphate polymerase domain-containing protein [candidate division KSB1 bacterium]
MNTPVPKGRNELKYYIAPETVFPLLDYCRPYIEHDEYALRMPDRRYTVRSLYYDSPRLDFYWEKIDGLKIRRKLRIRSYNQLTENSPAFLEIKRRYGTAVVKERAKYDYKEIVKIMSSPENIWLTYEQSTNGSLVLGKWLDNLIRWNLEPTVLIAYEREAYVGRFDDENNVRLTIDYNVRARVTESIEELFAEDNFTYLTGNYLILELKYNNYMPKWMRGLVLELNLQQQSISKYCMGIYQEFFKK